MRTIIINWKNVVGIIALVALYLIAALGESNLTKWGIATFIFLVALFCLMGISKKERS